MENVEKVLAFANVDKTEKDRGLLFADAEGHDQLASKDLSDEVDGVRQLYLECLTGKSHDKLSGLRRDATRLANKLYVEEGGCWIKLLL